MSLIVRKPGILTTVQDLGRVGARSLGINPGGAMDRTAVRILNTLLGNDGSAAVIETHFPAIEIEFDANTHFAIGGADLGAELNSQPIANWSTSFAGVGDILRFRKKDFGRVAYIAIKGGVKVPRWLNSASTNLAAHIGGHQGRSLAAGDHIDCETSTIDSPRHAGPSILPRYSRFPTVRVVAGSEFDLLTAPSERLFFREGFTLTKDCDRMGYRLSGKAIHLLHRYEMISSAVAFGTIQLLPDGQLIILMADHQTSGGYPRIANVVAADLPLLAQCGPGDGVRFKLITIDEAERLALRFESELNFLRVGCRLQSQNAKH